MENQPYTLAAAAPDANSASSFGGWRFGRDAYEDLQIAGTLRTNLLLVASSDATRTVLAMLWPGLREPIKAWRPGQQLDLPLPGRVATLILHDVNDLAFDDQQRVLRWLDETGGRIRVVSTSMVPLWPYVETGAFNVALYYRLNTLCVDVTARKD
jgi:hypothetical protein